MLDTKHELQQKQEIITLDAPQCAASDTPAMKHENPITGRGVASVIISTIGVIGAVVGTEVAMPVIVVLGLGTAAVGTAIKVSETIGRR